MDAMSYSSVERHSLLFQQCACQFIQPSNAKSTYMRWLRARMKTGDLALLHIASRNRC